MGMERTVVVTGAASGIREATHVAAVVRT